MTKQWGQRDDGGLRSMSDRRAVDLEAPDGAATEFRSARPRMGEHDPYYARYIALVPDGDIVETLRAQQRETLRALRELPESAGGRRYAEGKWSIREVISHMSDTERVFAYRALRFARNDQTGLPGFDENSFVANGNADHRTIATLCDEYEAVRQATVLMLASLPAPHWDRAGTANGARMSVRAAAWICAGHEQHHRAILHERY
ncbi:MAG: DinB family protein [Gemmatimonadota bacterium]